MSDWEERRAENRRLRNLAVTWIAGSIIVGIVVAVIIYVTGGRESGKELPEAQPAAQAEITETPRAVAHQAQVVTATPVGGSASGEGDSAGGSVSGEDEPMGGGPLFR